MELYRQIAGADKRGMPGLCPSIQNGPARPRRIDRWFVIFLSVTTVTALILRLYNLGFESLDMDEIVQVEGYGLGVRGIFVWAADMGQPLLDYLIGSGLYRLGISGSDAAVRLPAALFGAGSVFLLGWWAARMAGRSVGLASAIFLTVCPLHVVMSQHARQYTIFVFFALAALIVLDRARRSDRVRWWVLFSICFLLMLQTRWVGPQVIAVLVAVYTIFQWGASHYLGDDDQRAREKRNLFATTVGMGIPIAITVPIVVLIIQRSRGGISPSLTGWFYRASDFLAEGFEATLAGVSARTVFDPLAADAWFVTGVLGLSVVGIIALVRRSIRQHNRHALLFLATLGVFPVFFAVLYACMTRAIAKPQYLLLMTVPVCLGMAVAAKAIRNAVASCSFLAGKLTLVMIVSGVTIPMYLASLDCLDMQDKRDWRGVMTHLRENSRPSDAFAVAASDLVPSLYSPQAYGSQRYGLGENKFLPIRQSTDPLVLEDSTWSASGGVTWLIVYTDRMYLGYDQVRPPVPQSPNLMVHRFNGLFLVEARGGESAAGQLMEAIASLYDRLPASSSLVAPALLRARYMASKGRVEEANESLDSAIEQCRSEEEVAILRAEGESIARGIASTVASVSSRRSRP